MPSPIVDILLLGYGAVGVVTAYQLEKVRLSDLPPFLPPFLLFSPSFAPTDPTHSWH